MYKYTCISLLVKITIRKILINLILKLLLLFNNIVLNNTY